MASKKSSSPQSPLTALIGLVVVIISVITGVLFGFPGEDTSAPATTVALPTLTRAAQSSSGSGLQTLSFQQGFGARKGFMTVYFTAPTGSRDAATYVGGVDQAVIDAINGAQSTLDIAAFEWKNANISQAVVNAHNRGVRVRMAIDNEHVVEDYEEDPDGHPFGLILAANVPHRDDDRGGLMHNKFMIIDSQLVITGSMNFTQNGTYRNNNNMVFMRAPEAVQAYQAEFNEMYENGQFGSSRSTVNSTQFSRDGISVMVLFAPEDPVVPTMQQILEGARRSIRFMTFSFTLDEIGLTLLERAQAGVTVQGIFETTGSRTSSSELPRLLCAGLDIRQDGNSFTFHHKVFIVDERTVLTGSFNISDNATNSNDENMVIITDPDIAAQYIAEFERMRTQATVPPADAITCP